MTFTLADLKKRKGTSLSKITEAIKKQEGGYNNEDDGKFWKPERDKAGNGFAEIRFLAAHPEDDLPWVKIFSHSFKGPTGRWYIENCRSTIGEEDPVNDFNKKLWATKDEADKKQASAQKRKTTYISRIEVVNDPKHPENNGKQFFFKYGKKIFEKIMDKIEPTFEDEKAIDIFDLWDGANFKLRIKMVEDYPNYDSSSFEAPSPIRESDEEILEVVKAQESLKQFVDPSKFKSYDELDKKLKSVLDPNAGSTKKAEDLAKEMRGEAKREEPKQNAPAPVESKAPAASPAPVSSSDDDDGVDDFFKTLTD